MKHHISSHIIYGYCITQTVLALEPMHVNFTRKILIVFALSIKILVIRIEQNKGI
jgi:hypothetical protein